MQDEQILDLYFARDPDAIAYTAEQYGAYLTAIASNILSAKEDAEECVCDTYLRAWNAIPPTRPRILRAFLGRITRNLSINRFHSLHAHKRGGGQVSLALEELSECVSGSEDVEAALDRSMLLDALNDWLASLPAHKRCIFLRRYWSFDSVRGIAARCGMTQTAVSVTLHRLRSSLRAHLAERGFYL